MKLSGVERCAQTASLYTYMYEATQPIHYTLGWKSLPETSEVIHHRSQTPDYWITWPYILIYIQ